MMLARKWILSGIILVLSIGIILTGMVAFQINSQAGQKQDSLTANLINNKPDKEASCKMWTEFMEEYQ